MLQHHKFLIIDGKQHPKIFDSMDVKITPDLTKLSILGLDLLAQKTQDIQGGFFKQFSVLAHFLFNSAKKTHDI